MKKKTIIKVSLFILIPVIFILLIVFTDNKLSQCGRDPYNFLPETELAKAVYWCEYEKAKQLVNQGANINNKEGDDVTPLHLIIHQLNKTDKKNCLDTFNLLIESGADLNAQDQYGNTPLHGSKDLVIMKQLLDAKANPNIQDNKGKTPLHYQVTYNNEKYYAYKIELLLKHNARIDIKDNAGRSPLSIAQDRKFTKILKLFNDYEKKQQQGTTKR